MKKRLGCLSPMGLLVALLVIAAVVGYTLLKGGGLFSPGSLTAANTRDMPLEGFRSHAEFEDNCARCHQPWRGVDSTRCAACHTDVRAQIATGNGLHSYLENPDVCTLCHTEHQGRATNITAAALPDFPHQQVGFSLVRHQSHAEGRPFACADCHSISDYGFDQALCENCHTELDAAYMTQHVIDLSRDCLACHDGSGGLAGFDHATVFPLDGAHVGLECRDCHGDGVYKGLPPDCVACHDEPDVHLGQFGTDCTACHTSQAWTPARLLQHAFPLDHGSPTEVECLVCHPTNYVTFTCYDCHEHDQPEVEREHLEEGIRDLENCVECHPTGREQEDERARQT